MTTVPAIGAAAPDFSVTALVGEEFKTVSLGDYKGKWVLLFFYPLYVRTLVPN
jgi:peroxiredoxin (alkyl hydroperoxide reductase subunit C)